MDDVPSPCSYAAGARKLSRVGTSALLLVLGLFGTGSARADTLPSQSVMYSFGAQTDDGSFPLATITAGGDGNLYGTTSYGGANGGGTVFRLSTTGAESTLYSFHSVSGSGSCPDGSVPSAALVKGPDGNFYGTTAAGGANCNRTSTPAGTVFRITPDGALTTLYSFCSTGGDACTDGAQPVGSLVVGSDGELYGTTSLGGVSSLGSIFRISTDGQFTRLYSFCATGAPICPDGVGPQAGLVLGQDGNFYGTTVSDGDNGGGTVFSITPAGQLTTLYSFCDIGTSLSCPDGSYPMSGLVQGTDGNFYGTTSAGGAHIAGGTSLSRTTGGTVFSITADGTLSTLHSFCADNACADGSQPLGGLYADADGNLYGTTNQGGSAGTSSGASQRNNGTIFRIADDGSFTSIHSFCSTVQNDTCLDGRSPVSGLAPDGLGNLVGTTIDGGNIGTTGVAVDAYGTVYVLAGADGGGSSGGGGTPQPAAASSGAETPSALLLLLSLVLFKQICLRSRRI